MLGNLTLIQQIAAAIIPILFAITVHETAHGWVANRLGDPTARLLGRLTLNPIKHIDPVGTILVPGLLLWLGGFLFGWAKPVPITWQNLRKPRRDIALVALAGPASNLLMSVFWAYCVKAGELLYQSGSDISIALIAMGTYGVVINLLLMLLNLIPIPPLDGSRVVASLLPPKYAHYYNLIENYGFFILLLLLITGILSHILLPNINFIISIISSLVNSDTLPRITFN